MRPTSPNQQNPIFPRASNKYLLQYKPRSEPKQKPSSKTGEEDNGMENPELCIPSSRIKSNTDLIIPTRGERERERALNLLSILSLDL